MERIEQKLLKSKLEAQDEILDKVSRSIRDSKNELLAVKCMSNEMNLDEPELLRERIEEGKLGVNRVLEDLKEMTRELNPSYIEDTGLVTLLKEKIGRLEKYGKYQTVLVIDRTVYPLEQHQELTLFSIVNNAISNILEHASASSICIHLFYFPEAFILEITDNGQGLNPLLKSGLGLLDMKAKARLIGARVTIKNAVKSGTTVIITVPQTIYDQL